MLTLHLNEIKELTVLFHHSGGASQPQQAFFFFFQIAYLSRHWLSNWFLQIMSHSWCCSWLAPLCLMTAGLLSSGKILAL